MNVKYYTTHTKEITCNFFRDVKSFGIKMAVQKDLVSRVLKNHKLMHNAILNYLESHYVDLIQLYADRIQPPATLTDDCPIWVCWLQGEENMPLICKKCVESVRLHRGKHPVYLITMDNYSRYVTIPDYILRKLDKEEISLTHFSDILRANLLADHGGMWIDSTIYVTQDLPNWNLLFYTLKQKFPCNKTFISLYRWSTFFQGGVKNNLLHCFLRDFLHLYYKNVKAQIDYFLTDYIIDIGYRYVPAIRKMVDEVPYSCQGIHELRKILYTTLNLDKLNVLLKQNYAFKLTYKNQPAEIDPHSVYHYLFCQ